MGKISQFREVNYELWTKHILQANIAELGVNSLRFFDLSFFFVLVFTYWVLEWRFTELF